MKGRTEWRPDGLETGPVACTVSAPGPLPELLASVRRVATALEAPVQALRADRVLSHDHIAMANVHATRARSGTRSRAQDAAVEFLLFAACSRQIDTALSRLGVPSAGPSTVLLVALPTGPDRAPRHDALIAAAASAGFPDAAPWRPSDAVRAWWRGTLGLRPGASADAVERALLAAMAALAVAKS